MLRDVDLALAPGDAVHLVGANGSGKTSLLRVVAGPASPRGGKLARARPAGARAARRRVAGGDAPPARRSSRRLLASGICALLAAALLTAAASWTRRRA